MVDEGVGTDTMLAIGTLRFFPPLGLLLTDLRLWHGDNTPREVGHPLKWRLGAFLLPAVGHVAVIRQVSNSDGRTVCGRPH